MGGSARRIYRILSELLFAVFFDDFGYVIDSLHVVSAACIQKVEYARVARFIFFTPVRSAERTAVHICADGMIDRVFFRAQRARIFLTGPPVKLIVFIDERLLPGTRAKR